MRTNRSTPHGKGAIATAIAMLALTAGAALAATPSTTAYQFSSHPMISGTVVSVNDRLMVVDTDQGEQVALELDSRTMAPRDLAPGMVMRAEFRALEDCRFYAERIVPVRGGMSTSRLQAYANTHDSQEAIARSGSASHGYRREYSGSQASAQRWESRPRTVGEYSPGATMTATPTTADYQFSTRPLVTGRVVSVNDHRVVIETDQGQLVGMVMDSNTLLPGAVAPGTVLRVEFSPMKDGRYYVERIHLIGSGVVGREQAYAHTRDSDLMLAHNASDCGFVSAPIRNTQTSSVEHRESVVTPEPLIAQNVAEPVAESPETLPQTAGRQPLLLLLGVIALGAAGVVTVARGLRIV